MQLTSCIWWRLYSICKTTQEVVSDTIIYVLQEETKDPVTAMWLICCLNCYQFSWPNCYFCHCMHISIIIINSWAKFFVTQGSPGTLQLLYKKEAGKGHGAGVCPRKAPQGPAQLQLCCLGLCRQVWNNLGNRLQEVSTGILLWGAYSQMGLAGDIMALL